MRTLKKTLRTAALICAVAAMPASAPRAQEAAAVSDAFAKLVFEGCIPNMRAHASLAAFAKTAGLEVVTPALANNFLRTIPGVGYLKADPKYPMLLFGVADGSCRVYARFAPDVEAVAENVNKQMAAKTGFSDSGVSTDIAGPNTMITTHNYKGKFGDETFAAVLTTTLAKNTQAQVSFIVAPAN